ncbi:MAG: hypothetical protein ACK4JB_12125 [Reyranella sp.]
MEPVDSPLGAATVTGSLNAGLSPDASENSGEARTTSQMPPLFLHIGRGKSGSSTIQSLVHEHLDFMNSMGIVCPLTVHGAVNHHLLATALFAPNEDPSTIQKFRTDVRKNKRKKLFISAEALFSLTSESMERLKRHAGNREVRILCYVRDYPSWFQSIYAQRTKKGSNALDFDAYYAAVRRNVSALPRIKRWAKSFGWEAIHVRPLLPEALTGGSLITDVLHAMGVDTLPQGVEARNVAPHWVTLELLRALTAALKSHSLAVDQRSIRFALHLFEQCAAEVKPRRVQYLTQEQWRDLAELYRSDMDILGRRLNLSFPVTLEDPPERPFLPDISMVPSATKAEVLAKLNKPHLRTRLEASTHEVLVGLLSAR